MRFCRISFAVTRLEDRLIAPLIRDFKRRALLRPSLAAVVKAGRGDVGVPEPFLDLGDIGVVIERIGRCRRSQRMGADFKP